MSLGTATTTKILGTVALLAGAAAGWLLVLSPQTSELAEVRSQIETTRAKNESLRAQLVRLENQRKQLPATRTTARALAALFPPTADQPALFKAVTAAAAAAGIPGKNVTELTAGAPIAGTAAGAAGSDARLPSASAGSDLAAQTVTISVQGSYEQVQRLAENLEAMPRAYLVSSLTLGTGATPGTYAATVTGQMFVMQAATDPSTSPRR